MRLSNIILYALSGIIVFVSNAFCEQIIVRDCSNFIRATSNISEGSKAIIHIAHKSGSKINLRESSNVDSGLIDPTKSSDTESHFSDISSGDWIACGAEIESVNFTINNQKSSSGISLLAAGTGVLGGASVIAFGNQGGSNSGTIADTLENGGDPENIAATNSPSTSGNSSSSEAATRCLNDANVPDMSQSD